MRNNIIVKTLKLILLAFLIGLLFSCGKIDFGGNKDIRGKWLLTDGTVYLDNLDDDTKIQFSHFSDSKKTSSMDITNGVTNYYEFIEQNKTTWEFTDDGVIINASEFFPYVQGYGIRFSIENGSIGLFFLVSLKNGELILDSAERAQSLNGVNIHYYSRIKFRKLN